MNQSERFPIVEFERFLAENFDRVVGYRRSYTGCPIATWLRFKYQTKNIRVSWAQATINGNRRTMPQALRNFVTAITSGEGKLTGREALRILHKAMDLAGELK